MRHWLRQMIPSMFRRRLLLIASAVLCILIVLGTQMTLLTASQHEYWLSRAESAMTDRWFIPTVRGRIVDVKGRVLAEDTGSFDVAVTYPVISGQWSYEQALRSARRAHLTIWRQLDPVQRERLVARYQPEVDAKVEELWRTLSEVGGIEREELERRKQTIRARVEQMAGDVWSARWQQRLAESDEAGTLTEIVRPIGEQVAAHAVLWDIDDRIRMEIERRLNEARPAGSTRAVAGLEVWPTVSIERSHQRRYPLDRVKVRVDRSTFPGPLRSDKVVEVEVEGVATHTIGALRNLWREDAQLEERPFRQRDENEQLVFDLGGYRPGDNIGYFGLERSLERELRGSMGQVIEYFDTGRFTRIEPMAGREVRLTLDAQLQARIEAVMKPELGLMQRQPWHAREHDEEQIGQSLCGAAVVMEIDTGKVLAMVNAPGFSQTQLRTSPASVWGDAVNRPFLHRAAAMPYEPGSTLKPLLLAAAIAERKLTATETITCHGFMDAGNPHAFRCWIYKQFNHTHGPMTGHQAIAHSCNIYFYTLGQRMGGGLVVDWLHQFGMGRRQASGLLEEVVGDLPRFTDAQRNLRRSFDTHEARLMGIGQGPVRWTVLQAAGAYAALVRGGVWLPAKLYEMSDGLPDSRHDPAAGQPMDLGLTREAIEAAMQGMDEAVNEPWGTGHALGALGGEKVFTLPGVKVAGKSGTATAAPLRIDSDGDGRITRNDQIVRQGDHAWFIGVVTQAGATQPKYVVAVVVEYAGSGGATAGPIANQILFALRAEGYL